MTIADTANQPAPIPTPPDFPVTWEQPDDPRLFWTMDRMHCPAPLTPLTHALIRYMFQDAINVAMEELELPIRLMNRQVNTYMYMTIYPSTPPAEMAAQGKRAEERLGAAMARLDDLWRQEWLPEIERHLAFWEGFDLRGASPAALLAHLEETLDRISRLWAIHFHIVLPCHTAMSMFEDLYRDLFGAESALDAYRLVQGIDNATLRADRALWRLGRAARASAAVREVLETHVAGDVPAELARTAEGRAFLAELRAYLEQYGKRGDQVFEMSTPRWIEDPTPLIETMQEYLGQPDRDPEAALAALAAERDRLVAAARERLQGHPQPVVGQFEFFLKAAQAAAALREDHNMLIDFKAQYLLRQILLEFGRRLTAAGALDRPDDVFYLTLDELRESAAASPAGDRRGLVAERSAAMAHFGAIPPPPALGTPPPGPPPEDPVGRALGKVLGVPVAPASEPDVLRGVPASSGVARGPAKVLRSLADAGKLRPGDVLIAETTTPPWTPLFATAAAVVTDVGGVLSHGAIVAREYRIPAVVGAGMAATVIRDGQLVEVDGDAGVVRIVA
ncbi:MAG TPA: PEP-utilizing enzyme [Thermomicrobiales bacterium]|nr:PEP-utilizing enzyme [Thermomicrobiales bacterium]